MKKAVDIWYGTGDGISLHIDGYLIEDDLIEITDIDWLDNMGWEPKEDGPYTYKCDHLNNTYWVSCDDYGWSEKGFISKENKETELIANKNRIVLYPNK